MSSYEMHNFKKWMVKKVAPLTGHCCGKLVIPAKLSLLGKYQCIFCGKNHSTGFWLFHCRNLAKGLSRFIGF